MYNNQLKQLDPERVEVVELSDGLVDILHLAVGGQAAVLANTPAGQANALDITVGHAFNAGFDVEIQTWRDLPDFYNQVSDLFDMVFGFIFLIVLTVVIMSVVERTREIGTLRAIGWLQRRVRSLFVTEAALLGVLGSLIGLGVAAALGHWVINTGWLTWTPPGRSTPVPIGVDLLGHPALIPGALLLFMALACASAWWPARRAASLPVVEALRHA